MDQVITNFNHISLNDLEKQRQDTLRAFTAAEPGSSVVKEYIQRYNTTVAILNDTNNPRFDPLVKLPREIWAVIIRMVKYKFDVHWDKTFAYPEAILPSTMVSTAWRDATLSESSLWTDIKLYQMRKPDIMTALCLRLSGNRLLSIYINLNESSWSHSCQQLIPHRDKIERVIFEGKTSPLPFFQLMGPLSCSHTMNRIEFDWRDNVMDIKWLETGSPITEARGYNIPLSVLQHPASPYLTRISITEPLSLALPYLEKMDSLKSVILSRSSHKKVGSRYEEPIPDGRNVLGWTSLYLDHYPGNTVALLGRLTYLTSLDLTLHSEDKFTTVLMPLAKMKRLYSLKLYLSLNDPTLTFDPSHVNLPQVTELHFLFYGTSVYVAESVATFFSYLFPSVELLNVVLDTENKLLKLLTHTSWCQGLELHERKLEFTEPTARPCTNSSRE